MTRDFEVLWLVKEIDYEAKPTNGAEVEEKIFPLNLIKSYRKL